MTAARAASWRAGTMALILTLALTPALAGPPPAVEGAEHVVGPGGDFERIEDACEAAEPGDTIVVRPREGGRPFERVALRITTPRLHLRAAPDEPGRRVRLSGEGFVYSGVGRVPRAIVQFDPGADGCTLEGFELTGAHNASHNGAGVRINQANHVTVRDCEIFGNDMGIMSGGDGTRGSAVDQLIERCHIHHNGAEEDPGYNHNLYLGGTSVTLRFCLVHDSLTGHNVKSRAHHNRVEYCYVHGSRNREFDLVDARDTEAPGSHAVLLGNVIAKSPESAGNRTVIHFGQDGGREHDGTLSLFHNTIISPFIGPAIDLSTPKARALLVGNLVTDGGSGQRNQALARARDGADLAHVTGSHNWLSSGLAPPSGTKLDADSNHVAPPGEAPPLLDPDGHDFRPNRPAPGIIDAGPPPDRLDLPPVPGRDEPGDPQLAWQYRHPAGGMPRPDDGKPDLGAFESDPEGPPSPPGR